MNEDLIGRIVQLEKEVGNLKRLELGGLWAPVYDTTLGSNTNFDWNPVASGYSRFWIWLLGRCTDNAQFARVAMYLNGDTTLTNYYNRDNDAGAIENNPTIGFVCGATADSNAWSFIQILLPAYSQAIRQVAHSTQSNVPVSTNLDLGLYAWRWQTAAAVARIQIQSASAINSFISGSRMTVFAS